MCKPMRKPAHFSKALLAALLLSPLAWAADLEDPVPQPKRVKPASAQAKRAVQPAPKAQSSRRDELTIFDGIFGGGEKTAKKKEVAKEKPQAQGKSQAQSPTMAPVPKVEAAPKPMPSFAKTVTQARLAYEKGEYAQAAKLYESIPKHGAEYLRTREELAWSYLRASDWQKLRGLMPHLNSKLVPLRWRLEGRVLSAMIYLKDCQYQKVRDEMDEFQHELAPLTRTIDQKLAAGGANTAYWRALKDETNEAIFKMKFVRMELRSRLVMLSRAQVLDMPNAREARERIPASMQTYPSNGDIWADEVFQLRGEGRSACAALHQAKVVK